MSIDLSKDVSGRKVVFGIKADSDRYQTHVTTARAYGAEYAAHGITPTAVDLSTSDGPSNFSNALADPDCLGAHCEQGWGLQTLVPWEGSFASTFELLSKPAVAHVRDMPFYPWLREVCFHKAPWAFLSFADRDSADLLKRENPAESGGPPSRFHPHVYFDLASNGASLPWQERPIDCLYAGSYQTPEQFRDELRDTFPQLDAPLMEAFDAAKDDFYSPIWSHGEAASQHHGYPCDYRDAGFTNLLGTLNQMVRMHRRHSLLERMAKHPMHLIWSGDRPDIDLHPDTVILEPNTFPETVQLMTQAKSMVMSLNSFSSALSERMLTAMRQGAVVLSHPNELIDEVFTHGENILTFGMDQDSLDAAMAQLTNTEAMEHLRASASHRIEDEFHPRHIVRDHIQSMIDFEDQKAQ